MVKKGIPGRKRKNRTCPCVHDFSYYIKVFHMGADRHNGILMSHLLLVADAIIKKEHIFYYNNFFLTRYILIQT